MSSLLFPSTRPALLLAPDGGAGPSSGGSSPDAQLPANRDTGAGEQANTGNSMPSQADIAQLAQRLWEEEGRPEGRATEHWDHAEQKLREQAGLS